MDRKKRLQELEEKRRKLEEYKKNRGKTSDAHSTDSSAGTDKGLNLQQIDNLDDLLTNLSKVTGIPPSSTTPSLSDSPPKQPPKEDLPPPSTQSPNVPTKEGGGKGRLAVQLNVLEWSLAPKEPPPSYPKACQTDFLPSDSSEVTPTDHSHSPSHSQTVPKRKEQGEGSGEVEEEKEEKKEEVREVQWMSPEEVAGEREAIEEFLHRQTTVIERVLLLSQRYDYLVDYTDAGEGGPSAPSHTVALTTTLADERWTKHRSVTDVAWSEHHADLVGISYSQDERATAEADGLVLLWDTKVPKVEFRFHCPSPVLALAFSPFHPTLLLGGTYSGQVVLWDLRAKATPIQATPLSSVGHTHPLFGVAMVGSKNAHHFVSVSTDGRVCVWGEGLGQPVEVLELLHKLNKPVAASAPVAVTALSFPRGEVNTFFVGSEEGALFQAHRHGSKAGVWDRWDGHQGPITAVHCHPSGGALDFSQLVLSAATDWTVKLWAPPLSHALHSCEDGGDVVYDVKWCPSHPALFATVDGAGLLALWNLNEDPEVPISKTQVGPRALNALEWSKDGRRVLVGDSAGNVTVFEVGELSVPRSDEWQRFEETLSKLLSQAQEHAVLPVNL